MKNVIIALAIALPLIMPSVLFAKKPDVNASSSPKPSPYGQIKNQTQSQEREEKREELRERILERLNIRNANRLAKAEALTEKKQELVRSYFNRMVTRLNEVIAKINLLISRIEARLAIINDAGEDTSNVQDEIDKAKTLLLEAQADLDASSANIDLVLSSGDPKSAFSEIRNSIKSVKSKLVEVHRILVHLIGDIKGLRIGNTSPSESEETESPSPTSSVIPSPSISPSPTLEASPTATPVPSETPTAEPSISPTP